MRQRRDLLLRARHDLRHRRVGFQVRTHQQILCSGRNHVMAPAVEGEIDLGHHGAIAMGAGQQPPVHRANIGLVGMAAHHHIHRLVQPPDDVEDGTADIAIVAPALVLGALVDQDYDGLDPLLPESGHQRIDAVGFVPEAEAGNARRRDDGRRSLQLHTDEGHLHATEGLDVIGGQQRRAVRLHHIGGEIVEGHCFLLAQKFGRTAVEFMIAHRTLRQSHPRQRRQRRCILE